MISLAVFTSSVLALRKTMIIRALRDADAFGPDSARALSDTDLENPDDFPEYTRRLVDLDVIRSTPDGRYFLP